MNKCMEKNSEQTKNKLEAQRKWEEKRIAQCCGTPECNGKVIC